MALQDWNKILNDNLMMMPIVRLFCDIHDQEIEANSMYLWGSCMWFRSVCGEFAVDIPQTYPGYTPEYLLSEFVPYVLGASTNHADVELCN